jgi:hypothetical protein
MTAKREADSGPGLRRIGCASRRQTSERTTKCRGKFAGVQITDITGCLRDRHPHRKELCRTFHEQTVSHA